MQDTFSFSRLATDCVHVWAIPLDRACATSRPLHGLLDGDEVRRAGHFHRDEDRLFFVARRAMRRLILSRYVGIEPRHLSFSVNEWGKPRLVTDRPTQDIRFSQTRSRNWSLLAVSNSGELGIDLEYMDPSLDVDSLIQFLSPDEAEQLNTTPTAFRREAFFRCWSRKEAYLKAVGEGLRAALSGFSVPAHRRVLQQPVPVRKTSARDDPWFLIDLQAVDGFAAALVTRVPSKAICFQDPSLVL